MLICLMLASGLVANRTLAVLQTHTTAASIITTTSPQVSLPGTIYVSQQGSIYAISGSKRPPSGAAVGWRLDAAARAAGRIAARDPQVRRVLGPVSRQRLWSRHQRR